ncbi:hypothetical protein JIG36_28925 [Actinoplanes sp. LDG1-06]|uniref:Uncharacterized protein n=1 Tax=Paractinoplanes ovalisporus TaxID=2810368 RepID=A0ABS2AI97_9ACTN|nr:hypothetical protein [Actinoplanes ovalisporus]MBM2619574.1 hypothetical protein [Actinoplanes ovalisporus]
MADGIESNVVAAPDQYKFVVEPQPDAAADIIDFGELVQVVERLRIVGYDPAGALAGAVGASALLSSPAYVPDVWSGGSGTVHRQVGSYLAEVMRQAAERSDTA